MVKEACNKQTTNILNILGRKYDFNYEPNAYYIFDRAYDSFKELYRIHLTGSFFVVRTKSNLKCKFCKWQRRMPKNILSDAKVKLIGYTSEKKYLESFRVICFHDEENDHEFTFLTNPNTYLHLILPIFIKKMARGTVL
jgi:hypothetical protein